MFVSLKKVPIINQWLHNYSLFAWLSYKLSLVSWILMNILEIQTSNVFGMMILFCKVIISEYKNHFIRADKWE